MNKEELAKIYQEQVLKTNGGNDDYVVALLKIGEAISELDELSINENKEQCWVIQRDDGMYFDYDHNENFSPVKEIYFAYFFHCKTNCKYAIRKYKLKNCHAVKVEMKICKEK